MVQVDKLKLILLSSPVALVVQHAYLYPAPDISLELVPDALLGENFPVGCCIGGSRIPDVPGTVHPDLGTHIVPGIFYHISFSRNWGVVAIVTISVVVLSALVVAVSFIVVPSFVIIPVTAFQSVSVISSEPFLA